MNRWLKIGLLVLAVGGVSACRRKGPPLPAFKLMLGDSVTVISSENFPTGEPIVLVYFSPDCDHCQQETSDILSHIDSLKNVKFYFITLDPIDRVQVFNEHYKIKKYPNIVAGRDFQFGFVDQIKPTGTPWILIYNRYKELKAIYTSSTAAKNIINITKNG